ncbi:MAG: SEC-C metal-binding domain-containing protein [Alistipes inops]
MCDALAQSVGAYRSMFLSRFKRNDPCPCGSGKKLKRCHGLKPVDLFPF